MLLLVVFVPLITLLLSLSSIWMSFSWFHQNLALVLQVLLDQPSYPRSLLCLRHYLCLWIFFFVIEDCVRENLIQASISDMVFLIFHDLFLTHHLLFILCNALSPIFCNTGWRTVKQPIWCCHYWSLVMLSWISRGVPAPNHNKSILRGHPGWSSNSFLSS